MKEEILNHIAELKNQMENAEISYNSDVDITEVPDGVFIELTGMKKGYFSALEQLKEFVEGLK